MSDRSDSLWIIKESSFYLAEMLTITKGCKESRAQLTWSKVSLVHYDLTCKIACTDEKKLNYMAVWYRHDVQCTASSLLGSRSKLFSVTQKVKVIPYDSKGQSYSVWLNMENCVSSWSLDRNKRKWILFTKRSYIVSIKKGKRSFLRARIDSI